MRTPFLLTIIMVASLSSTLFAQDCANPLLAIYDLPALDEPESGADLPYCTDLQDGATCCSAETVAGFQDRANELIGKLNNYAAARDLYIAQLRNSFYDRFTDILQDVKKDHCKDIRAIRRTNASIANELQSEIDSFTNISSEAREINSEFAAAMDDYQAARNNCFTTALQVQASSWCLACNPNYADEGVADDGTVTFSDELCETINDACWPFFNQSARFNPLIRAREAYWRLVGVSDYLNNYTNTSRVTVFNISEDPYDPLSTQQEVSVPDEWVGGDGVTRQCINLWAGDDSLAELLTVGASLPVEDDEGNEEEETEVTEMNEEDTLDEPDVQVVVTVNVTDVGGSATRLLQDALAEDTWSPDLEATGLDFDLLRTDPGDVFGVSKRPKFV